VDYVGILRAGIANIGRLKSQGASTITMQVARNVYLSSEKTYTRKIYEILLTYKLEHLLSKDQILEIYMNQIFLGNRAYGFASAAETYFGKPLQNITIAEAAMLAGLPKAPSAFNPIANPKRARSRQLYIIERMEANGYITAKQATQAKAEPLRLRSASDRRTLHAEFVAETVRQMVFAQYGEDTYTRGLNVYTTVQSNEQIAAYKALRQGLMDFERRQVYRGPEKFINLPTDPKLAEDAIDDALEDHPDNGDVMSAVVLEASLRKVVVVRQNSEQITITGAGLAPVQSGLSDKASPSKKIRKGAVIRIVQMANGSWEITQLPEVEGAFVAMTPQTGAIRALVGGFDFTKNKFNHATQAWRQPGSSFKPFIYSAALESGFSPSTLVNDSPLFFDGDVTGGQPWEPKNYDGKFDGPMSLRTGLAKSKNMVSIRVLQAVGTRPAQEWVTRFGFDADKHPPYLTMALGAGSVTVMQMATGYSVFANGGFLVPPHLITRITDYKDRVLVDSPTQALTDDMQRVIPERNAYVMTSLLQEVTRSGTAARAQAMLKRQDIYGKTGTTNDAMDAWFAGYHRNLASVVWIGYDTPRKLGDRETGGGLSLPVWISFMETALSALPVSESQVPEGVVQSNGDWTYTEYAGGAGVKSLGMDSESSPLNPSALPPAEERNRILDLFRQ
jgi:penicillin-binding protein 1A